MSKDKKQPKQIKQKKAKRPRYTSLPYPVITLIAAVMLIVATVCGVVCGTELYEWSVTGLNYARDKDGNRIEGDVVVGGRINILVMGVDKSESLSDTIMLVSIDTDNKKIATMSILRDTRIIMGGSSYKINSLISTKGKEGATMEAVKSLIGEDVPINYYVTVKTKAFRDVVDELGGVKYNVPHVPNGWSQGRRGMYYDDPYQDLHIAIPEGEQILDGEAAEGLVRFRNGYSRADEERVVVQQDFIKELIKQKLKLKYVNKIPKLYNIAKDNVHTNVSPSTIMDIVGVAKAMLDMDTTEGIQTFSMPGSAEYVGITSYFIADTAKTREIIEEYFMDPPEAESAE